MLLAPRCARLGSTEAVPGEAPTGRDASDPRRAAQAAASLGARWRRLSLRSKFALPIAVTTGLLFAVLLPGVLYLQRQAVLDGARDRGLQLPQLFGPPGGHAL